MGPPPSNHVYLWGGIATLAAAVFVVMFAFSASASTSTFPAAMVDYSDGELAFARRTQARRVSAREITAGVTDGGVVLADLDAAMSDVVLAAPDSIVLPIYFGPEHAIHAIGFVDGGVARTLLNPAVRSMSGRATVVQQPRFCTTSAHYQLPTFVIVSGSFTNSSSIVSIPFENTRAALVATLIAQLDGEDPCAAA